MVISTSADCVMVISKDATSNSANYSHGSDYQRVHELGLKDFWGKETDEVTGKKWKKGITKKKDEAAETGTR
jgi:hypothetical protein